MERWVAPKGTFLKKGTEMPHRDLGVHSGQANKEGGRWVQFAPTQYTARTNQRVAQEGGLLVLAWSKCTEWTVQATQWSEGMVWKLGTCDYCRAD